MTIRRLFGLGPLLAACLAVTAAASGGARADDASNYPQRPVKVVVGYTPGGATDIIARLVASELSEEMGQPFIVENKPGAGSNIATENVVRSAPDGYTLLVMTIANASNMSVYKHVNYDTNKDLVPIAQLMASPSVLVASPKSGIDSLQALIKEAKAHPGTVTYASTGVGGSPHLAGEMLKLHAGINVVHVPYKGTTPALTDLIAGTVSVGFVTTLGMVDQMKAGNIRPLAVAYSSHLPELPDVPTMAEAGLPDFEVTSWNGMAAPAGTPKAITDKLGAAVNRILQKPKIQERIRGLGGIVILQSPQQFGAFIQAETDKWAKVVKAVGISIE